MSVRAVDDLVIRVPDFFPADWVADESEREAALVLVQRNGLFRRDAELRISFVEPSGPAIVTLTHVFVESFKVERWLVESDRFGKRDITANIYPDYIKQHRFWKGDRLVFELDL